MHQFPEMTIDELLHSPDTEGIWLKYCGFLNLSTSEFMAMQRALLAEQIHAAMRCELGQGIFKDYRPENERDFRRLVPLSTYADYHPYLDRQDELALPAKPAVWVRSAGNEGKVKWVPYTLPGLERLADDAISALILSSARRKGDVRVRPGLKAIVNVPPAPSIAGIITLAVGQRLRYESVPLFKPEGDATLNDKTAHCFSITMLKGSDFAVGSAEFFASMADVFRMPGMVVSYPPRLSASQRLIRARLKSKIARRAMRPGDIWRLKGLVCGGMDTGIYREKIAREWGVQPLDTYIVTETGFIAMQSWNKKNMTLLPCTSFYEFIPEEERLKNLADKDYVPRSILLNEVEAGKTYELVMTSFRGGPFLRYRIGDLVKVESLKDEETGVRLPQISFYSRAGDLIEIADGIKLDERIVWSAIQALNLPCRDWKARKETAPGRPVLTIYLELSYPASDDMVLGRLIDQQLAALNSSYRIFRNQTAAELVKVILLAPGTSNRLRQERLAGGETVPASTKHMNPSDETIKALLRLSTVPPEI